MHNKFVDKNRRNFNLRQNQVKNVLPEHFVQYYPKFVALLEKYYDWQDEQNATELLNHLFAARDINETDITLLSYIEDELLLGDAYFEGFGQSEAELRAAANFSNTLFRSKGTKFAIEWFFRSFYGVDAEVLYPKENVFEISDQNSTLGGNSLRYLTDDKLYQTYALLVRVGIPITKWRDTFKLFAHPAGMYLGGEVLLSDVTNVVTAFPLGDSSVTTKSIPSYSLTASASSVDEGQSLDFTITGTNVVDNIDAVYYYIKHVTTSDSDFATYYDSSNPGYVPINDSAGSAVGTFSIRTVTDELETESTEQFKVYIVDRNDNVQDSATIDINNVEIPYSLTVSGGSLTFNEYDIIEFVVNADSTAPDDATLQYYVDPIGANPITSADFISPPPLVGSPASVTLDGKTGSFTLQTLVEKTDSAEADKTFRVILKNGALVKDSSGTISIQNVVPTFDLTFNNDSDSGIPVVTEGSNLNVILNIDNFNVGTLVNWSLSGAVASDPRTLQPSGSFVTDSTSTVFSIPFSSSDSATVSGVSGILNISPKDFTPNPYTTASFKLIDLPARYNIQATPASVAEGDSATITFTGSNIPDGTKAYFFVDFNQTDSADFVSVPPLTNSRQEITFNNNVGSPSVNLQFASNGDPQESFIMNLASDSSVGVINDLATRRFLISDTQYDILASSTTVNEGNSILFTLDSDPGIVGGTYYYTLSGENITPSDFVGNSLTGTFPVVDRNGGSFSVSLANDVFFEGTETFVAEITNEIDGITLGVSPIISISDTSVPVYSLTVNDVTEGSELTAQISGSTSGERVYFEVTGDATDKLNTTQVSAIINSSPQTISFGITVDSDTYESNPTGTVTATRLDYLGNGGSTITTDTFSILDKIATATLTASDTTPNEGDTVTFTISDGVNLPPTRYYSIQDKVFPVKLSSSAAAGQKTIPLQNTTGLQVGMETNTGGINGTIASIQTSGITMTDDLTSTISSGTVVNFATPAVFRDFVGLPFGNTTTSTFDVTLASDSDVTNDLYTFVLRDAEYGGNDIASEDITIQDQTSGIVTIDTSVTALNDYAIGRPAEATIRFNPDGTIFGTLSTTSFGTTFEQIGTWVSGSFDPADYTIYAEITSLLIGSAQPQGSYETVMSLSTARLFTVYAEQPVGNQFANESQAIVRFTIRGPQSDNIESKSFTLYAWSTTLENTYAPISYEFQ